MSGATWVITTNPARSAQGRATTFVRNLRKLRAIRLALPEGTEKIAWGAPTFRVRDKLFAHFRDDHHGDGRIALWCKAPEGVQASLVDADPERFFVPPYVGPSGWLGVRLEGDVNWDQVSDLVEQGYRMTAPRRLCAQLDAD